MMHISNILDCRRSDSSRLLVYLCCQKIIQQLNFHITGGVQKKCKNVTSTDPRLGTDHVILHGCLKLTHCYGDTVSKNWNLRIQFCNHKRDKYAFNSFINFVI